MSLTRTIFSCQKCEAQSLKWIGRCLECGAWGTFNKDKTPLAASGKVTKLEEIKTQEIRPRPTKIEELNRVLGGGLVAGGIYLLAGEPGIGKSTLVAQLAKTWGNQNSVLYVSGEESPSQLKERFLRLDLDPARQPPNQIAVLTETKTETIIAALETLKPNLVVIDSVQTLTTEAAGAAGSLTQLRASLAQLAEATRRLNPTLLLIGQVTKSSNIAGHKNLEHLVDVVLTFEGDREGRFRLLRASKNRFGPTDEVGVFEMTAAGLQEVSNPSTAFLEKRQTAPGNVVTSVLEGQRPILVELQALVSRSRFPYPERRASGFAVNRLNMLAAVLDKIIPLQSYNLHLNVTSGFQIREPAADLAAILAIASSLKNKSLPKNLLVFGEVGLGGELRPVRDPDRRLREARKLGLTNFIEPRAFGAVRETLSFLKLI